MKREEIDRMTYEKPEDFEKRAQKVKDRIAKVFADYNK